MAEVKPAPKQVIDQADRHSATWLKLKAYLEGRLASLDRRNRKDYDERKTARLRGSIAEIEHILSLGEEKLIPPPEDEFKD